MTPLYRPAGPEDVAFVVDSWVESFRHAHAAGLIPMPQYQPVMRKAVAWMLEQPGAEVVVAELDGMLVGWIALNRAVEERDRARRRVDGQLRWVDEPVLLPLVLYVFVKDAFRRHGIARGLFDAARVPLDSRFLYASKTPAGDRLKDLAPKAEWRPLAARFPKTQPLERA